MTAFGDLNELVNRFSGGNSGAPQSIFFWKDSRVGGAAATAPVTGRWVSLCEYEGFPSAGAAPSSTGAALDNTTQGGLKQTDPSGGRQLWCSGAVATMAAGGTLLIYDRLAHDGAFDATNTGAQTVSFTPPSRYSDGVGNQIFLEINTLIGSTGTTVKTSYTNQAGTAGQVNPLTAFGATGLREAQRWLPLPLAAGDTGVRNVASVTVTATTGTAGAFSVVLAHPLMIIPSGMGAGMVRDLIGALPSMVEIQTDACLAMALLCQGTVTPQILGSIHMAER